ncbi:MAG: galactitol-1-phosphate 5-dehydrogenase [Agathobacter sp.]|uniref:galactitol-1-phosphate 5-dehydrogenase n=1 Tax=Agathobacter sp. TaxID=2021311 RepID=UPI0025910989|nr:galactitol-1-phosphate 5-dehydrogenase [Agathobacter sp.]MCR5677295.1 galactitol-1-phosphate 5-dehydrogenase [Agathobacter sp.]
MKAYVLDGIGQLNLREYVLRDLQPGEALVQVAAAGICGSDIPRIFETGTYHFPTIPGHEFAGVVKELYAGADEEILRQWMGKRVAVFPLIPCRTCRSCANHQYEMCSNYNYLGSRTDGGFAEYCIVPVWNLLQLPDEVSFAQAAMMEPAAVALHAIRRGGLHPDHPETGTGKRVLVMGLGTIGGLIAQWISLCGVTELTATGHHAPQEGLMHRYANENYRFINTNQTAWTDDENTYDLIFDCINDSESVQQALRYVKPGGQIVAVGNPKKDLTLQKDIYWKLLRKQVCMTGTWNSSFSHDSNDDWQILLRYLQAQKLHPQALITHRLPFAQLPKGLEIMRLREEFYNKIMIDLTVCS